MDSDKNKEQPVLLHATKFAGTNKTIPVSLGTAFFGMDARDTANNRVIYYDAGQENHTINQRDINLPITVSVRVMNPNTEQGKNVELSGDQLAELQEQIAKHFRVRPDTIKVELCGYPSSAHSIELTFPAGTPIEPISYGYEGISMEGSRARSERLSNRSVTG